MWPSVSVEPQRGPPTTDARPLAPVLEGPHAPLARSVPFAVFSAAPSQARTAVRRDRHPGLARACGAADPGPGPREPHGRPSQRDDRRQPPERARLRRRLGPGLRGDPPDATTPTTTSGRARSTVPAGDWEYKAALNDSWDENYGAQRRAGRRQHPAQPRRADRRQVLLRPRQPLGHRQRHVGHRRRARQLPERARLPRRLGAGLPALVAPGPRRRRHLHVRDDRAPGRHLRGARSRSTRAGTRTTARAACRTARTSPFTVPADNAKVTFSYDAATHVLTILAGPRPRQQRRVGRPAPRLARARSTGRRAARCRRARGDAPLPDVPRRRHRRRSCASSASTPNGQQRRADDARRQRTSPATRPASRPRRCDFWEATLPERRRRTTSGTASSSPTAPTPTTTPTTRRPSTAASARRPTTPSTRAGR